MGSVRPARLFESKKFSPKHRPHSACRLLPRGASRLGDEAGGPKGRNSQEQSITHSSAHSSSACPPRAGVFGHSEIAASTPKPRPAILRIAFFVLGPQQFDASGGATSSVELQPAAEGGDGLRDPKGRNS